MDIGLTKHWRFVDKAEALAAAYPGAAQTWLMGFDTLERLMAPRYYDDSSLASLASFWNTPATVVCMKRGESGGEEEWVERWRLGGYKEVGGRSEWAEKVRLVEAPTDAKGISSSRVREEVKKGKEVVRWGVTKEIAAWISEGGLYTQ